MSGKLADLVAHNEGPAKKYYLLSEKSKTSVEVSKKLGRLMRSDDSTIRRHRIRQAISRIRMAVFPMSWLVKVQQKRANHVKAQIWCRMILLIFPVSQRNVRSHCLKIGCIRLMEENVTKKTVSDRPQNIEFNIEEANAAREKVKMWSVSYKRESNTRNGKSSKKRQWIAWLQQIFGTSRKVKRPEKQ